MIPMVAKIKDINKFSLEIAKNGYTGRKFSTALGKNPTYIHIVIHRQQTSIPSAYTIAKKLNKPFEELFDLVPR